MPVFDAAVFDSTVFDTGGTSGSFTLDATLEREVTGSFTLNGVIKREASASFTLDAVLFRVIAATLDAVLQRTTSGSFTLDAVIGETGDCLFDPLVFDSTVFETCSDDLSFTLDAVLLRAASASFTLDATLRREASASFTLDAVLAAGGATVGGSFTLDAVLRRTASASFTLDAVLRATTAASKTLDAILRVGQTGSLTLDARLVFTTVASWTLDATFFKTTSTLFYLRAFIENGDAAEWEDREDQEQNGGPGGPGAGDGPKALPIIRIWANGIDIAPDVMFQDAQFTTLVNGGIGQFNFRVRDTGRIKDFTTGMEVAVDINGVRRFGGYATLVTRLYTFPAVDTSDVDRTNRFWRISGVDYNILFAKRILYDHANPANVGLRTWPAGSASDTVIRYVISNYTDLLDDGITLDLVENVGSPNPDKIGVIGSGGLTAADAMREINRLISGVWYIDPYKQLVYTDVDTPSASKGLTDHPTVGTQVGYRDFNHVENGAGLVNDAMVWGAGQGSTRVAFARSTDATSISQHGRWQFGEFTTALYKQVSVNERASTIVYGTDQSKRGGKDDQVSWTATTFDHNFTVGQKVAIESDTFGVSDVVPIRRYTLTFPTTTAPQYQLVLSHEVDEPWNFFEFYFPPFPSFDFDFDIDIPPFNLPPLPGGCAECGITDTFTRTVASSWGDSDSGLIWEPVLPGTAEVVSGEGHLTISGNARQALRVNRVLDNVLVTARTVSASASDAFFAVFDNAADVGFDFFGDGDVDLHGDTTTVSTTVGFGPDTPFSARIVVTSDTTWDLYLWAVGDPEPSTPTATLTDATGGFLSTASTISFGGFGVLDVYVTEVDIDDVDACTEYRFDNFNRTIAGDLGVSDSGNTWVIAQNATQTTASTTGSRARFRTVMPSSGNVTATERWRITNDVGPWAGEFTMTAKVTVAPSTVPTGGTTKTASIGFEVLDSTGRSSRAELQFAGSGSSGQTSLLRLAPLAAGSGESTTPFVATDGDYYIKWHHENLVTSEIKAWKVGTTEPALYQLTITPNGLMDELERFGTINSLTLNPSTTLTHDTEIDWIDFQTGDGTTDLCYEGPCEDGWTFPIDVLAKVRLQSPDLDVAAVFNLVVGRNGGGGATDVFGGARLTNTAGSGVPLNQQVVARGRGTVSGASFSVTGNATISNAVNQWLWVRLGIDASGVRAKIWLDGAGEPGWQSVASGSFPAPGAGNFSVLLISSAAGANVYYEVDDVTINGWSATSQSETFSRSDQTGWGTSEVTGAPSPWISTNSFIVSNLGKLGPGSGANELSLPPCTDQISPGDGDALEGPGRTDDSGDGSQTVFQLPVAFVPGSTRVYVNGLFQRPGIAREYTEQASAGTITFADPPPNGASIQIFYEANGSL